MTPLPKRTWNGC